MAGSRRSLALRAFALLVVVGVSTGSGAAARRRGGRPGRRPLTPDALLLGTMIRSVMPAIISVVRLIPSAIVALSRDRGPEHQRWATAAISSILTYWLS